MNPGLLVMCRDGSRETLNAKRKNADQDQITPCSTMLRATFMKPATFAPFM